MMIRNRFLKRKMVKQVDLCVVKFGFQGQLYLIYSCSLPLLPWEILPMEVPYNKWFSVTTVWLCVQETADTGKDQWFTVDHNEMTTKQQFTVTKFSWSFQGDLNHQRTCSYNICVWAVVPNLINADFLLISVSRIPIPSLHNVDQSRIPESSPCMGSVKLFLR